MGDVVRLPCLRRLAESMGGRSEVAAFSIACVLLGWSCGNAASPGSASAGSAAIGSNAGAGPRSAQSVIAGAGGVTSSLGGSSGGPSGASALAGTSGVGGMHTVLGAAGAGGVYSASAGAGGAAAGAHAAAPDASDELFDPTSFPRFDFDLPPESVKALQAVTGADDPRQDTYVTATFTYDKGGKNEVTNNVGLRLKGEGSFRSFDQKPALKVKLDEFVKGQSFRGLARLTLNNNNDDPSFIAERLAYEVYRAAGVAAPRCNNASVYVNGAFYGVYTHVETEDKRFLSRWFGSNKGNLYEKDGMQDLSLDAASDFDLETNETENDRNDLNRALMAIDDATAPSSFLADVGGSIDMAKFLEFTAVEGAVNQWDMYSYSTWWSHNFRVYDDPATSKFVFIPWGNDLAMKPHLYSGRAYIKMFELEHKSDDPNEPITTGVLFQRCLASPVCKKAYKDTLNQLIPVYEGLGLEAAARRYYSQIKSQVYADTRKATEKGPLTNAGFDAGYQSVLTTIKGRVAAMRADLNASE